MPQWKHQLNRLSRLKLHCVRNHVGQMLLVKPPVKVSTSYFHTSSLIDYSHFTFVINAQRTFFVCSSSIVSSCHHEPLTYHVVARDFSVKTYHFSKESSKLEGAVKNAKESKLEQEKNKEIIVPIQQSLEEIVDKKPKRSIWDKVVDEVKHYYHGFRLLFIDVKVSAKLIWRVLHGEDLSRRESKQLVRTVSDLFRLLPFSIFIIVPFMELLLPVALKLFPSMLPSTFQSENDKELKIKRQLKVKLEMAKFLQTTLDEMAAQAVNERQSDKAKNFALFFEQVRRKGGQVTNEEIISFSKLFEDEITLDNLTRPQLVALCRVLEIQPIGTTNFLRFHLRMKLRALKADDKMIQNEGIESLTIWELQQACRTRGMRAYGVSQERLRLMLSQWLQLSLNEKVPASLLLLSRALFLPEDLPTEDQLKVTISQLPEEVAQSARVALREREGKISNLEQLELIKTEEAIIAKEREERRVVEKRKQQEKDRIQEESLTAEQVLQAGAKALPSPHEPTAKAPELMKDVATLLEDKAPSMSMETGEDHTLVVTPQDIETLEGAIEKLSKDKNKLWVEREELESMRAELSDYSEDVQDLQELLKLSKGEVKELRERTAAKFLFKKVNSMIEKLDRAINSLEVGRHEKQETANKTVAAGIGEESCSELIKIDEMIDAIQKVQRIPNQKKLEFVAEVLSHLDTDHDGRIHVYQVLRVIDLLGEEDVQISKNQILQIIDLVDKEHLLDMEEKLQKLTEKENQVKALLVECMKDGDTSEFKKEDDGEPKPPSASASSASSSTSGSSGPHPTESQEQEKVKASIASGSEVLPKSTVVLVRELEKKLRDGQRPSSSS